MRRGCAAGCTAGCDESVAVVVVVLAEGTGVVLRLLLLATLEGLDADDAAAAATRLVGSACSCGTGVLEMGWSRRFSSIGAALAEIRPFVWERGVVARSDLIRLPFVSLSEMPDLMDAWLPDFWVMARELGERNDVVSVCALLANVLVEGESRYS